MRLASVIGFLLFAVAIRAQDLPLSQEVHKMNDLANATAICQDPPACSTFVPITSFKQLLVPAGGLGDFFGPGTTVGIPFAAQLGVRVNF